MPGRRYGETPHEQHMVGWTGGDDTDDPIPISANCQTCSQAVELEFSWTTDEKSASSAEWICPHCGARQEIHAIGRVIRATKSSFSKR